MTTKHSHDDVSTLLDRARVEEQMLGQGRFANELAAKVQAVPLYPAQPEGSPWAGDAVPKEPPLGFAIDDMGTGR